MAHRGSQGQGCFAAVALLASHSRRRQEGTYSHLRLGQGEPFYGTCLCATHARTSQAVCGIATVLGCTLPAATAAHATLQHWQCCISGCSAKHHSGAARCTPIMVLSQASFSAFQEVSRPYFWQSSPFTTAWGLEHVFLQVGRGCLCSPATWSMQDSTGKVQL